MISVRGVSGSPSKNDINSSYWKEDGPFELSPERGRFALTFSIIEDKSFNFSIPVAQFSLPDLGYHNGKFVSLFAPGVSFIAVPGYLIGKIFNVSQLGTFSVISLFAFLNAIMVYKISTKIGANDLHAKAASLIFIFATPAFSYATTLYQHHITTFLILISVLSLLILGPLINLLVTFLLYGIGISVDYPNALLMVPLVIIALGSIIEKINLKERYGISIDLKKLLTVFIILIPLSLFFWYNKQAYGSSFQLAGTVKDVYQIENAKPIFHKDLEDKQITNQESSESNKSALGFFYTRNLINGLYIHILSPDRGILFFTPILLFGIGGLYFYQKKDTKLYALLVSIIGINFVIYSMWGDPWGGWAFGSRYLIPSYAIISIFIPFLLSKNKALIFTIIFIIVMAYSVSVNSLGALTSISNPPKVEVTQLELITKKTEKYTFLRNFDLMNSGKLKSYIYQVYFKDKFTTEKYYYIIDLLIISSLTLLILYSKIKFPPKTRDI